MPAMHAFPWLRQRAIADVDETTRIEIDALLGDADAEAERIRRREEAWEAMGAELG